MPKIFSHLLNILFPPKCVFCGGMMEPGADGFICRRCRRNLPYTAEHICCARCGKPVASFGEKKLCADCMKAPPRFVRCVSALEYTGNVRRSVLKFKNGKPEYAKTYAELLAVVVGAMYGGVNFDALVAAPISPKRLKRRGYDQTARLSAEISARTGIPYIPGVLEKIRETPPQSSLNRNLRETNLNGAFRAAKADKIAGKTLLSVDDVMTTGSTLNECAKVLKAAGAKDVYAVTLATTAKRPPQKFQ